MNNIQKLAKGEDDCPERKKLADGETSYCNFSGRYCLLDRDGGKCSYYDDYLREVRKSEDVNKE